MEAVRGRFHFYGINYKGCMIQVVLLRNKWVEQLLVYFYNNAVENNFLLIKLSCSDFILFYNSKNRHLEFLNLSPQGLISSIYYLGLCFKIIKRLIVFLTHLNSRLKLQAYLKAKPTILDSCCQLINHFPQ